MFTIFTATPIRKRHLLAATILVSIGHGGAAFAQETGATDSADATNEAAQPTQGAAEGEQTGGDSPAATGSEPQAGAPVMSKPGDDDTMPDAGSYSFDPAHSQIMFSYDHMGFSTSRGFVNGLEGTITLDPADLGAATVEASFPLDALRTVSPELDTHLMGPDFFDVSGDTPIVTFVSTGVEVEDDDEEARVTGDLTLNGVTRQVTLDVEFNGAGLDPITQQPTIGFSAEGEIDRSDYGLSAFVPAVDDEIELEISVEAKADG
ncbi:Polyisoprenoid-binding protein YceI [Paracoccus isoporae]|uniref:Polyisoprenoid-binding protein YceI n=1 Tax=Paracoccus isoporae TaxID=591205 RepID=A0A1G6TKJ1_9RHOB|nr:YceI family protein [Paracoccus isoporae]SDD29608.1 Polyisoprenoid-binding protein YceI [Paracoccus isoporae]